MEDHVPFPHSDFLPVARALASALLLDEADVEPAQPDPDEFIQVQAVPARKIQQMLNAGEIQDVKSALALTLALDKLGIRE